MNSNNLLATQSYVTGVGYITATPNAYINLKIQHTQALELFYGLAVGLRLAPIGMVWGWMEVK